MAEFGRVCVLMGGDDAEREVSLQSGQPCLVGLLNAGVDAYGLDVQSGKHLVQALTESRPDCVLNLLHGPTGEGGPVQGLLELLKIPYVGSGVLASALAMDKVRTKNLWQQYGLPTPEFVVGQDVAHIQQLRLPVCVKPVVEGSSVGVTYVDDWVQLPAALELASRYGQVMVEEWIIGEELTVSIVGDQVFPVIEIKPTVHFYDYDAKYVRDDTEYDCDWGHATPDAQQACQALSLLAYQALGCRHWGRIDLMRDEDGQFWLIEANTLPGMTTHSLLPKAAEHAGLSFEDLLLLLLAQPAYSVNHAKT